MKFDLIDLEFYHKKGLLEKNEHPYLPLTIWNYSRECQYSGEWDEITKACRGLVVDHEGNVVAKAFDKFFNMEEHRVEEIPNEPFEVFDKLDGSLGILFYYSGEWILATKGSFTSDQAIKGMEMLKKYDYESLTPGFTYLFEIIFSANRIVCHYEFEDLVLLAVIDNRDGSELDIHEDRSIYRKLGFKIVRKHDGIADYKELKAIIADDEEGFVIRFKNGFRMKIKGEEYVRLHRILTGFSNVDIWECLRGSMDFGALLERVPDEFDAWVREVARDLSVQFENIERDYKKYYAEIMEKNPDRKAFAEEAKRFGHPGILFSMLDGRSYADHIWRLIRPTYQKPFWKTKDDE